MTILTYLLYDIRCLHIYKRSTSPIELSLFANLIFFLYFHSKFFHFWGKSYRNNSPIHLKITWNLLSVRQFHRKLTQIEWSKHVICIDRRAKAQSTKKTKTFQQQISRRTCEHDITLLRHLSAILKLTVKTHVRRRRTIFLM